MSVAGDEEPVPYEATALRPEWDELPGDLRGPINRELGGEVTAARVIRGGFSPGFAGVVHTGDGRSHFVKAISAQLAIADWYRLEARVNEHLPPGLPVPRLRWHKELDGYVVLRFDPVNGRMPAQPWQPAELNAALRTQARIADLLARPPAGLRDLIDVTFSQTMATTYTCWQRIRDGVTPCLRSPAGLARRSASWPSWKRCCRSSRRTPSA